MNLQSLELLGFKSFADKTIFNFHEGVTAIVGPNGCGKSNLLDAVRWVLGEQSAKSLRGGEMADIIFNGSDTRKPIGFAEVSLTLTDCATELDVDWHEVRVTRRVYRDGNSEYLLNKTTCRLRDIQNLFADTGVARSAYSMMEQGKIDMILSSRPEDRRAIFEEAAGITKYKAQKREALRKLEATEANLLRIGDIIKEVKRQIGSLQRQAGKARRYQALHADLRVLDTHYSRKQLEALESGLKECQREIDRLSESEQEARARIDNGETTLAEERQRLDKIDLEIADGRAQAQRLQSEIAAHRTRIELNKQRAQELNEMLERSRQDIAAAEAKRSQQSAAMQETNALIEKTEKLLQAKEAELKKMTGEMSELRAKRTADDAELEQLELARTKSAERINALEDELSGITIRREATGEHLKELDTAISKVRAGRDKIEKEFTAARSISESEEKNIHGLVARAREAGEWLEQDRQRLAGAEKSLIEIERALAEKESRLEVLKQLNEEGEGLAQGSQAVLKGLDDPKRFQPAVLGALVARAEVDPKFSIAIEAALGRNLHTIVLQDSEMTAEIMAVLTDSKLGQAALFVPGLGDSSADSKRKVLPERAIAWATDKIDAPEILQPLVRQLLHDVAIFENLDHALRFKKTSPHLAAATLAGEFISVEGIVFGGRGSAQKESLLERKSRISILTAESSVLNAQRDGLRQKRDEAKTKLEKTARDLEEARTKHQAADFARSASKNNIALLERELHEATHKIDNFISERSALAQQLDTADAKITAMETELEAARDEFNAEQDRQLTIKAGHEKAAKDEEKCAEKLTELRLAVVTERQRLENLIAQRNPMTARETELNELIAVRSADIATFEKRLSAQAVESNAAGEAIKQQTVSSADSEKILSKLADQRAKQIGTINEGETDLRKVRDALSELHDRRGQEQVRLSQLQMKIDHLAERVAQRYQVDLRGFQADQPAFEKTLRAQLKQRSKRAETAGMESANPTPALNEEETNNLPEEIVDLRESDLEKLIVDLTRQLDNMGPVNLDAVHEYDELEERYQFLEKQNNDLTAARRELLDVIARINSTTKQLFAETFAHVRVNFREMFAEMFGGGHADLSLMDESDPLNCGIEITAKPPGKQLQSISLLSGGERSMVAVALLFAIYMVRPSPFCVLDEVDAALDESSINRFIKMLDRFARQSQFVIITHNKRTIAKADVLYGVTMEERGVSKLVGMKLTERPSSEQKPTEHEAISSQRQFALAENGHEHKPSFAAR
ncbi:MAG: chromosome segregation protein SMC [Verrucomicrobia bacterium]|nr:MAG: chromosome segregation protein SMC [Verrucomicrobiota bacterium]